MEMENQESYLKETTGNQDSSLKATSMMWRFEVKDLDNNWEYAKQFSERNIGDVFNEFYLFMRGCGFDIADSVLLRSFKNGN